MGPPLARRASLPPAQERRASKNKHRNDSPWLPKARPAENCEKAKRPRRRGLDRGEWPENGHRSGKQESGQRIKSCLCIRQMSDIARDGSRFGSHSYHRAFSPRAASRRTSGGILRAGFCMTKGDNLHGMKARGIGGWARKNRDAPSSAPPSQAARPQIPPARLSVLFPLAVAAPPNSPAQSSRVPCTRQRTAHWHPSALAGVRRDPKPLGALHREQRRLEGLQLGEVGGSGGGVGGLDEGDGVLDVGGGEDGDGLLVLLATGMDDMSVWCTATGNIRFLRLFLARMHRRHQELCQRNSRMIGDSEQRCARGSRKVHKTLAWVSMHTPSNIAGTQPTQWRGFDSFRTHEYGKKIVSLSSSGRFEFEAPSGLSSHRSVDTLTVSPTPVQIQYEVGSVGHRADLILFKAFARRGFDPPRPAPTKDTNWSIGHSTPHIRRSSTMHVSGGVRLPHDSYYGEMVPFLSLDAIPRTAPTKDARELWRIEHFPTLVDY
ncbi:hypothetical protein DFH06DRAFT_1129755 [Mycena polygramma]|nr:hypothetical protein DFH06DRAFT_1129755 [Mycena polygramma]